MNKNNEQVYIPIVLGFDMSYKVGNVSSSEFACISRDGYIYGVIEATKGSEEYGVNSYSKRIYRFTNLLMFYSW